MKHFDKNRSGRLAGLKADAKDNRSRYNVRNSLVNYYLLLMFTFFPIFLSNQYAHARNDKYFVFLVLSSVLVLSVGFVSALYLSEDRRAGIRRECSAFTVPDAAMVLFFLFAVVSTVLSEHPLAALTGSAGRENGLIIIFFYAAVYFIVTRFFRFKTYVIAAYLTVSSFVAALAALNFFYIDPFGLLEGYSDEVVADFGSTIGNKNTIAAFCCLFLPVAVMLFTLCSKRALKILSGISILCAYWGLLCSNSSSAYLGLIAIILVMAVFAARSFETLRQYTLALFILFSSGKLLWLFALLMQNNSKGFEPIPDVLIYSKWMFIPILLTLAVFILMTALKKSAESHYPRKAIKAALIALGALIFCGLAGSFVYFSVIDTETNLGIFEKTLRFNERWGTHRGFMWIYGLKEYMRFDAVHKIFGSGPDTFYYVFQPYFGELLSKYGDSSTDCIHNEYLNYLITQGILGLLSYLTLLFSVGVRAVKKSYTAPLTLVFISAVICYAAQAVVNLYLPITTPTLFLFLSMAEALNRQDEKELGLIQF